MDAKIKSYDGGFVAGKFDTSKTNKDATVQYDNGDTYVGPMKNSMRNGKKGRMTFAIGGSYDGMWSDDKRDGEGNQTDADGGVYNGEWEDDKRHTTSKKATGKQTYANGDTYVGKWEDDKRHGKDGTQTYANGDTYEGKWEDDKWHGKDGTQTYANGDKYEGKWEYDKRHGTGTQTFARESSQSARLPPSAVASTRRDRLRAQPVTLLRAPADQRTAAAQLAGRPRTIETIGLSSSSCRHGCSRHRCGQRRPARPLELLGAGEARSPRPRTRRQTSHVSPYPSSPNHHAFACA